MAQASEASTSQASGGKADAEVETDSAPEVHALENKWTLWFDNFKSQQQRGQTSWGDTLKPVYTFGTVEDFWRLYNNIKPPSWLGEKKTDFHLFKKGIAPTWEDSQCESGGKWTIFVPRGTGNSKQILDKFWLHSLLACIGEQFHNSDEICGVVVNIRAGKDKICLWTKTASNEAAQINIGKQFKEFLEFNEKCGYLTHKDASGNSSRAKDCYTI